jgi:ankyrin repeat protein
LIKYGGEEFIKKPGRNSLLFIALANGGGRVLQLLLERGASVAINAPNRKGLSGRSLLMLAFEANDIENVKLLVSHGAVAKISYDTVRTMMRKDPELVKVMLSSDPRPDLPAKSLIIAIQYNNTALTEVLIDAGARVNGVQINGFTPLCYAIEYHRPDDTNDEMVKLLLSKGARADESCSQVILAGAIDVDIVSASAAISNIRHQLDKSCAACIKARRESREDLGYYYYITRGVCAIHLAVRYACRTGPLLSILSSAVDVDKTFRRT